MKLVFGLIIGFILLVGVIASLPFLLDLNQYQDRYKPLIEEALNRKVQLQDIRLTIWPRLGVRLGGVTILDDPSFSSHPFASLTSMDVGVKLLPLLTRTVEVEEITLRDPAITVIKNQAGVMNVSTIGAPTIAAQSPAEPGSPPAPGGDPLQILALFAVDRVSIERGTLIYRDLTAAPVEEYQAQDLDLLLTSVRLGQTPSIHLTATLLPSGLPVALDGAFGPLVERLEIRQYDVALELGKIALNVKGALVGGMLNATLSSPVIDTADLPVALPLTKPVQIRDLVLAAAAPYPLKPGVPPMELADISNLSLALITGQSSVQVKGTLHNGRAHVTVSSPSIHTADLPVALPLARPVEIKDLSLTANTRMPFDHTAPPLEIADVSDLRFAVALGRSLVQVTGTLLNGRAHVQVSSPSIHTADLPVALPLARPVEIKDLSLTANTRATFDHTSPPLEIADVSDLRFAVALGRSLVQVTGTLLNGRAHVQVSSPSIHTADLPVALPLARPVEIKDLSLTANTRATFDHTSPPLEIADVSDLRMNVMLGKSMVTVKGSVLGGRAELTLSSPSLQTGELPVETGLAQSVELRQLLVKADLKGRDAHLSNLSFQLFNGLVKAEGGLSTGSTAPPFHGKVRLTGVQLGPALKALSPDSRVSISGTAAMDLAVAGRGFSLPDLTRALEGPGHLRITNGTIEGVDLMDEAVSVLKVAGVSPDHINATAFSTIETDVMIKQGLVHVQKLLMDSHDFQATGAGTVGFDQALNLTVQLNLSQALSRQLAGASPVARIAFNEGRLRLPFLITGTIQTPSYAWHGKSLAVTVQEQLQEKAQQAVKGLLDGTTDPKNLKQQGKDLLKELLGR